MSPFFYVEFTACQLAFLQQHSEQLLRLGSENAIAVYMKKGSATALTLTAVPAARWRAVWINPITGETEKEQDLDHRGGPVTIAVPRMNSEFALHLSRKR